MAFDLAWRFRGQSNRFVFVYIVERRVSVGLGRDAALVFFLTARGGSSANMNYLYFLTRNNSGTISHFSRLLKIFAEMRNKSAALHNGVILGGLCGDDD